MRRHHAVISALYGWLTSPEIALAEVNPARAVPPPKLPQQKVKALTRDQVTALVEAADKTREPRRNRALVLFLLFLTFDGYSCSRHTVRRIIYRLAKIAGFHAYPHQFRHTAAIEHLRHGMDLVSVQHLLGHSNIQVTRGYLEALSDKDVEERAKRTSPTDHWRL